MCEMIGSLTEMYNVAKDMFIYSEYLGASRGNEIHYCKECGTDLKIIYLENTIYMVVCPWCEIIHLVKASCPERALGKIGAREVEEVEE